MISGMCGHRVGPHKSTELNSNALFSFHEALSLNQIFFLDFLVAGCPFSFMNVLICDSKEKLCLLPEYVVVLRSHILIFRHDVSDSANRNLLSTFFRCSKSSEFKSSLRFYSVFGNKLGFIQRINHIEWFLFQSRCM